VRILHYILTVVCTRECVNVNVDRALRSSSAATYREGQLHEFRNENSAAVYVCNFFSDALSNCPAA